MCYYFAYIAAETHISAIMPLTALASGASTRRMHNTDAHRDACAAALANPAALH